MSLNPEMLRYTRDDIATLLNVSPHNVSRSIRSKAGFPQALPGTFPPLWSKRAVDAWFNTDGGRREARQAAPELSERLTFQTSDEIEQERDRLHAAYGRL